MVFSGSVPSFNPLANTAPRLPHLTSFRNEWTRLLPCRLEVSSRSTFVPHKPHASGSYHRHPIHLSPSQSHHYPCQRPQHPCQNHALPCQPPHQNWLLQRCARAAATVRVTTCAKGAAPTWLKPSRSGAARASRQKALPRPSLHLGQTAEALTRPAPQPCRTPRELRPLEA